MKKIILGTIIASVAAMACPGVKGCPMNQGMEQAKGHDMMNCVNHSETKEDFLKCKENKMESKNLRATLSLDDVKMLSKKRISSKMERLVKQEECVDNAQSIEDVKKCVMKEPRHDKKGFHKGKRHHEEKMMERMGHNMIGAGVGAAMGGVESAKNVIKLDTITVTAEDSNETITTEESNTTMPINVETTVIPETVGCPHMEESKEVKEPVGCPHH